MTRQVKYLLLFTIIIFHFGRFAAQNGIYFKPYLELKASSSYAYGKTPLNSNSLFRFENRPLLYPHPKNFGFLRPGLLIGYSFCNYRLSIESGIGYETAISGYRLHYNLAYDSLLYYPTYVSSRGGTGGLKIPLSFALQLWHCDSIRLHGAAPFKCSIRLKFGLNFYRQSAISPHITLQDSINTAPGTYLKLQSGLYSSNNRSVLYQLGIESELVFKKLKGFCLSFYYLHGRRDLSTENIKVTVNNHFSYLFNVYGRGSGFCLQLSKKINL